MATVPTEVTLSIWAGVLLITGAVGKGVASLIQKGFAAFDAKLDFVIKRQQHNTEKLNDLRDCLDSTSAQYIIDYRLFEHGLISKPAPAVQETGATETEGGKDGEH